MSKYEPLIHTLIMTIQAHAESQIVREQQIDEFTRVKYIRWVDPHTHKEHVRIVEIRREARDDGKRMKLITMNQEGNFVPTYKDGSMVL